MAWLGSSFHLRPDQIELYATLDLTIHEEDAMLRSNFTPVPSATSSHASDSHIQASPVVWVFLEQLRRMPLGDWAAAAARLDGREPRQAIWFDSAALPGAELRARLRELVNSTPEVAAQVRWRVLDLIAVAEGFLPPREVRRMKKAALTAALALQTRPDLQPDEFARLYAPFMELIPLTASSRD